MRDVAGFSSYYSTSTDLESAMSSESQLHIVRIRTAVAKVTTLRPRLNDAMIKEISKLPRWSPDNKEDYHDFFESHGTHVVVCAVLGGILRILSRGATSMDTRMVEKVLNAEVDAPILTKVGVDLKLGGGRSQKKNNRKSVDNAQITVFRDGGEAVASELPRVLEQLFSHLHDPSRTQPPNWSDIRARWIEALKTDPVLCPDDPQTQYWWLYQLDGLTDHHRTDLKAASKSYLEAREAGQPVAITPQGNTSSEDLPREANLKQVEEIFKKARHLWDRKFLGRVILSRK